jgi:hypothetical protein
MPIAPILGQFRIVEAPTIDIGPANSVLDRRRLGEERPSYCQNRVALPGIDIVPDEIKESPLAACFIQCPECRGRHQRAQID